MPRLQVSRGLASCGFPGERSTASPTTPGGTPTGTPGRRGSHTPMRRLADMPSPSRRSSSSFSSPAHSELAAAQKALSPGSAARASPVGAVSRPRSGSGHAGSPLRGAGRGSPASVRLAGNSPDGAVQPWLQQSFERAPSHVRTWRMRTCGYACLARCLHMDQCSCFALLAGACSTSLYMCQ